MNYHLHTEGAGWEPEGTSSAGDPQVEPLIPFVSDGRNPGDMHEPKPYTGPLDWEDDPTLYPLFD